MLTDVFPLLPFRELARYLSASIRVKYLRQSLLVFRTSRSMATGEAFLQTNITTESIGDNVASNTKAQLEQSYAEDAMWILSCTFVIFTMQSGKLSSISRERERERERDSGERERGREIETQRERERGREGGREW